jgi:hypothetical protein
MVMTSWRLTRRVITGFEVTDDEGPGWEAQPAGPMIDNAAAAREERERRLEDRVLDVHRMASPWR